MNALSKRLTVITPDSSVEVLVGSKQTLGRSPRRAPSPKRERHAAALSGHRRSTRVVEYVEGVSLLGAAVFR